jgi:oxygen-independent coproporphyrinogen-3 oxidase
MGTAVVNSSNSEVEVLFHPELLKKFDINGPRYTSYPSADRFDNAFAEADYLGALERVAKVDEPLSL